MNIKGILYCLLSLLIFVGCTLDELYDKDNNDQVTEAPEGSEEPEEEIDSVVLSGEIIGTRYSVDYNTSSQSESVNTKDCVFDGDFDTFFASYARSNTWVGLDLGHKHIITKVGYAPRPSQPGRVELALIEGANSADFSDALPLYIIKEAAQEYVMTYADIHCSRGFRYVRYVTPNDCRCNIAELEFHGYRGDGDDSQLYQLTNLPTVVINTEGAVDITSKENEINSRVYIISENGTKLLEDEANWQNANIWYVKAICANRLDDLSWAIEALQQAIILDPHLIEIARLDSDVMDIIDILVPLEENQPV